MASTTNPDSAATQALPIPISDHSQENTSSGHQIAIDEFDSDEPEFENYGLDSTSLSSSIIQYEYENGRRYHSRSLVSSTNGLDLLETRSIANTIRRGITCTYQLYSPASRSRVVTNPNRMPNDEEEQDRMDLSHDPCGQPTANKPTRWLMLMKGELHKVPVKDPQRVLDLGTGTGIWALDMAENFPQAHVIGNDISPIQPGWTLPNVEFIVENFEDEWLYEHDSFDFIHARLLAGLVDYHSQPLWVVV
ncbi:hypothetical protein N7478_002761 [Penicillium angulare]|uniref:uncharacterized protein n=1 Tax=Penicillium angulare TaxID=116970 RepID=UPI00254151B0|nr:uncharacterized protein N7478_002761 [Penicillium angulare]KAJ5287075.1 hypothetical protein N7478_002761 [Penicillium angulare]